MLPKAIIDRWSSSLVNANYCVHQRERQRERERERER